VSSILLTSCEQYYRGCLLKRQVVVIHFLSHGFGDVLGHVSDKAINLGFLVEDSHYFNVPVVLTVGTGLFKSAFNSAAVIMRSPYTKAPTA